MRVELIPQIELGNTHRLRVGDVLSQAIADPNYSNFRFAVAYARISGLNRLAVSIESLINRGGHVSGAIGIDDQITSVEVLEQLALISTDSSIFHSVSDFIFHPKIYAVSGDTRALVIVGSPNLTRDGLFRNIEVATALHLDLQLPDDLAVFNSHNALLRELLNTANPNVQPVNAATIQSLLNAGVIKREAQVREPGSATRSKGAAPPNPIIANLFPRIQIPVAPPFKRVAQPQPPAPPPAPAPAAPAPAVAPPAPNSVFIMQLSAFDASHRTGVKGTAEMLVPHDAIVFFPPIVKGGRKYPDTVFDVALNTPTGRERHTYRLWYYEFRATGTKIDEYRLRMDHDTIDLSTLGGGDLLVINKLPTGSNPAYEVTILAPADHSYATFNAMCDRIAAQNKRWGMR
jgi:HKD family nuclease